MVGIVKGGGMLNYTYRMRTDTVSDEEGKTFTVYGIEALDLSGRLLELIPDVLFDKEQMKCFVSRCNKENISLLYLLDEIEALIG